MFNALYTRQFSKSTNFIGTIVKSGSDFTKNGHKINIIKFVVGSARGVMVIVEGNGHGDMSSKPWTRLIVFHIALIPLGKVWIQLIPLQLWVNSRTDLVLQPWWGN